MERSLAMSPVNSGHILSLINQHKNKTKMKFSVSVKGITPYMQHRMDDTKLADWEKNRKHIIERPEVSHEDIVRAEYHCYRNVEGKCYIPADHFRLALIGGGTFLKSKVGARTKSMKSIVAAMFMLSEEEIMMPDFDAIDKRSAVNKNVKARVMVVRPKWTNWEAKFTLEVGEDTITKETITELITSTGNYIGIGSYRPTNNGYFGRFALTSLDPLK